MVVVVPQKIAAANRRNLKTVLAAVILLLAAVAAGAGRPPLLHVPHAASVPKLTADPADPAWAKAAATPAMTLSVGPEAAGLRALPTRVLLLWDAKYLYLRFVCRGGSRQSSYKKHDDPLYHAAAVEVFLDPKGDGREWIELEVSPNNVVFDQLAVLTTRPISKADGTLTSQVLDRDWWTDLSWNLTGLRTAAWPAPSAEGETGWVVDLAVPADPLLRRLGRKTFRPMRLRANLLRCETRPGAAGKSVFVPMNWAPVRFGCPHISPAAMGTLVLDPPPPPQAGKDQAGKDQAGKDQAGKDQAGKDQAGKDPLVLLFPN